VQIQDFLEIADGKPADLVVRGGKLVNVHVGEIYSTDIAIQGDRIIAVGDVEALVGRKTKTINASGKYLTPGLIDCHIHVYGSHLSISEFARTVVPRGTTVVATDFYEFGIVTGLPGVRHSLQEARRTPLKILFVAPVVAYMQNRPFGANEKMTVRDLEEIISWPETIGINEPPPAPIFERDAAFIRLVDCVHKAGKIICGHACDLHGLRLNLYLAMGARSDHECVAADEALEKARLGMRILIREGSAAKDLEKVVKAITGRKIDTRFFAFCTDEKDPIDLLGNGHIDHNIRKAIQQGVEPVIAVQMASLNAAEYFGVSNEMGSISPGKVADLLIIDDISSFKVSMVIVNGSVVAEDGRLLDPGVRPTYPDFLKNTLNVKGPLSSVDFQIPAPIGKNQVKVRVIGVHDGTLISERTEATLPVKHGKIECDVDGDVLKIALIERYNASGRIGRAFIKGTGLKSGAVASTFNPVSENLLVVGSNDSDMVSAANGLIKIGGGFLFSENGKTIEKLALPLAGLASDKPAPEVRDGLVKMHQILSERGCKLKAPFLTLGFMAMPYGIPSYKISEYGLVDVDKLKLEELVIE
jgi:adenine deaminase